MAEELDPVVIESVTEVIAPVPPAPTSTPIATTGATEVIDPVPPPAPLAQVPIIPDTVLETISSQQINTLRVHAIYIDLLNPISWVRYSFGHTDETGRYAAFSGETNFNLNLEQYAAFQQLFAGTADQVRGFVSSKVPLPAFLALSSTT